MIAMYMQDAHQREVEASLKFFHVSSTLDIAQILKDTPVRGRVILVFVMAFVDGMHEGELPVCRLHVGFPCAIEQY